MGWTWEYDAGVRLAYAAPGRGDLLGRVSADARGYRYAYGEGDEIERIVDEAAGTLSDVETGAYGRILSRGDSAFGYDEVGRRTEDDRFVYLWNWRSELVAITVKDEWPTGSSPFAGHRVDLEYDALGRLLTRLHLGALPEGVTDESQRPFIEKRAYVWDGDSLAAEIGFGDADETIMRWRKTYVPGARGLDLASQVMVEDLAFGGDAKLFTYIRDELGTVVGVVAEDEGSDPSNPPIPARYFYSPYGEAHVERGPELRRSRFEPSIQSIDSTAGQVNQTVPDTTSAAHGALRALFTAPLAGGTLAAGVSVEQQGFGGWRLVDAADVAIGLAEDSAELRVLLRSGWQRGATYRVRLNDSLTDTRGRPYAGGDSMVFTVPGGADLEVAYERSYVPTYESYQAAADTLGGRFPGGQNTLFHGLWTDPVTGLNYARARWYDARNASWLSEDPLADIDSPNLYAFVGWKPNSARDASGMALGDWWDPRSYADLELFTDEARERSNRFLEGEIRGAWNAAKGTVHAVMHPVETFNGIKAGAKYLYENWDDIDLVEVASNAVTKYVNASPEEQGEMVGAILFEVASGGAIAKGATKLKMLSKLDNVEAPKASPKQAFGDGPDAPSAKQPGLQGVTKCITRRCFSGETLVMAEEGMRPIEEIEVGDRVWAVDDETGERVLAEVVELYRREVDEVYKLSIGGSTVETTRDHPIYVVGRGWVDAEHLAVGDLLVTFDGAPAVLEGIEVERRSITVYNFAVRGLHNYFVSDVQFLAHNCGDDDLLMGDLTDADLDAAFDNATSMNMFELPGQNPHNPNVGLAREPRIKGDESKPISYHVNWRFKDIKGSPVTKTEVRYHSRNPNADPSTYSHHQPTVQINSLPNNGGKKYYNPETGVWDYLGNFDDAGKAAAHVKAGTDFDPP